MLNMLSSNALQCQRIKLHGRGISKIEAEGTPRDPFSFLRQCHQRYFGRLDAFARRFFALYIKTKYFHWHISGANFRGHHLLLDEQGGQILTAML